MKYMLDTNILIYLIKNRPPSEAKRIHDSTCSHALRDGFQAL